MRISTAEIKSLMKDCAAQEGMYTTSDFCDYIRKRSEKEFTSGQIAGALAQLVDTGHLVRVERGLYRGTATKQAEKKAEQESGADREPSSFRKKIVECLQDTKRKLTQIAGEENILEMDEEDYRLVLEIKKINEEIEEIIK